MVKELVKFRDRELEVVFEEVVYKIKKKCIL